MNSEWEPSPSERHPIYSPLTTHYLFSQELIQIGRGLYTIDMVSTPTSIIAELYTRAVAAQQAGRLVDAEKVCRRILGAEPENPDALQLLGLIAFQSGHAESGIELLEHAICINDRNADYFGNLGVMFQDLGRFDEAIEADQKAIALNAHHFGAWLGVGNAELARERPEAAIDAYTRALAIRPDHADAQSNLGVALHLVDRYADAADAFRKAIAIEPGRAELHSNLGDTLSELGQLKESIAAFSRSIELKPDHPHAYTNLSALQLGQNQTAAALATSEECLRHDAGNRSALALKAFALNELGREKEAAGLLDFERFVARVGHKAPEGYASLDEFNVQLAEYATQHPTLTYDPGSKSTRGGQQSRELLTESSGAIVSLEQLIRQSVTDYIAKHSGKKGHPYCASAPKNWRITAWATVLDAQGHQLSHIHPAGWLSGVYYVRIPPVVAASDDSHAGWIEFGRPPEDLHCKAEPLVRMYQPQEGTMYLFPSYFYHRTIPFESDEQRISIAFDVLPENLGNDAPDVPSTTLPTAAQELMRRAWELFNGNRVKEADELCRQVLEQVPEAHEAWYLRSMIAWKTSDVISAESHMRRAIELCPDEADYWFDFGWCLRIMQRSSEALQAYEKGLSIKPDNADAYINVAALLTDMNRNEEARTAYREAIRLKPTNGTAYYGLALMTRFKEGDAEIPAMERLLDQVEEMGERDRSNLFFALGKAADNLGDYDKAFEYYAEGNRIKRNSVQFDVAEDEVNTDRIIRSLGAELLAPDELSDDESELSVFVLGMPRSGTTLVEQVLDSHPEVAGSGEINDLSRIVNQIDPYMPPGAQLPEAVSAIERSVWRELGSRYIEALRTYDKDARRVVDKLPFNYTLIGLISLMLPNAKIIHCTRHPLDTCLSCYLNSFSGDRGFTYDLDELGRTFVNYHRLMKHWKTVLPAGTMLDVAYEDLVEDLENTARRMIDFIGLEWSDSCLEYYKNPRIVNTASFTQVRQPVYSSSVGRWKCYAKHLKPLRCILDDAGIAT